MPSLRGPPVRCAARARLRLGEGARPRLCLRARRRRIDRGRARRARPGSALRADARGGDGPERGGRGDDGGQSLAAPPRRFKEGSDLVAELSLEQLMQSLQEDLCLDAEELEQMRHYDLGDIDGVELISATPRRSPISCWSSPHLPRRRRGIRGSVVGTLGLDGSVKRLRTIDRRWKVEGVHPQSTPACSTSRSCATRTIRKPRRRCCQRRCRSRAGSNTRKPDAARRPVATLP